jgi:hypothetical protein
MKQKIPVVFNADAVRATSCGQKAGAGGWRIYDRHLGPRLSARARSAQTMFPLVPK